jgi:starch phosphorylase
MEASGTSGMKATLNGALHVSQLDGWWDEAYAPGLGWALGEGIADDASEDVRDRAEAAQLMDLLESEIVPLFFQRDVDEVPLNWLESLERSIAALAGPFSAQRMINDYADRIYRPLARRNAARTVAIPDDRSIDALAA